MTRPKMPPTPASSTEIKGQDHSTKLSSLQLTFELPPSAITSPELSKASGPGRKMSPISPTSTLPYLQPSETVKARRRSSTAQQKEAFALPPPPTRSRKIIQMKPRPQEEAVVAPSPTKGSAGTSSQAKHASGSGAAAGSKATSTKKQPSATSAAGRKIARRTAHSLIERRRRSKMNEEFAVLKGLIPACTGEMHKLAILQASIEYVRYLEDCITKLKEQNSHDSTAATPTEFRPVQRSDEEADWAAKAATDVEEDGAEDVEMTDSEAPSPSYTPVVGPTTTVSTRSNHSSISPVPQRHHSTASSASSVEYQLYNPNAVVSTSARTSPYQYAQSSCAGSTSASHSALTSPALRPQLEIDHEVSAALLMLGSGRANTGPARGMSVQDLLSS
ncbi:hypothetical protein F5B22DRAFT_447688 [Xylaria bambusicola]|uniref:uncharacterized protein n=1 Tax=Xylaria bambusicola TaxID=326684 RepID=UPI002008D8B2|nr:uncharacterized protein F5B22DRAFT_447688 [Xylaria bambusicola]KAI0506444.1 hypothetical protein F5B22DRAFT_447688 [Xylaria bambusicola]